MTPHAQAALDGIDLDRGTAHVHAILHKQHEHGGPPMTLREVMEAESPAPKTSRKARSDKGKPKPPKPAPAPEGKLTREQASRLYDLAEDHAMACVDLLTAENVVTDAKNRKVQCWNRYQDYLQSLTAQS